MMIKTDSHADSLGTRDFVFSCHNRSFAATWSPLLSKPTETLIDSELVEFLNIPIKKIEERKIFICRLRHSYCWSYQPDRLMCGQRQDEWYHPPQGQCSPPPHQVDEHGLCGWWPDVQAVGQHS